MRRYINIGLLILIIQIGCTHFQGRTGDDQNEAMPEPQIVDDQKGKKKGSATVLASHAYTTKGYERLKEGDYNGAIRLLERAVSLNPHDGPGYYYLAEAWIGKGNMAQAIQFNRLAQLYLKQDTAWSDKAVKQRKRIKHANQL